MDTKLSSLCKLVRQISVPITFSILEVGAVPLDDNPEPFYQLLEEFPGSTVTAFEVDEELCHKLNQTSQPGIKFYPIALGEKVEVVDFFETNHPMCSSLYRPNEEFISNFNNLEVAALKQTSSIHTRDLDSFILLKDIKPIDFIKIDIQGAELSVFKGGIETLKNVLCIVSEVEFIDIYHDQPLFGDVDAFLRQHKFMFHKFLGLAGRALKPIIISNNPNVATQHMWSDAVFIRALPEIATLHPEQQIKLGLMAYLYGSLDLTFFCFNHFDKKHQTTLANDFLTLFSDSGS